MTPSPAPVHRFEVWPTPTAGDPAGEHVVKRARSLGAEVAGASTAKIYLLQGELSPSQLEAIRGKVLANPVTETANERARAASPGAQTVEVHPLPGVMDPAAQSVRESIRALTGLDVGVSTGRRVDLIGLSEARARDLAIKILANPAIHAIHTSPFHPADLPKGKPYHFKLRHVELRRRATHEDVARGAPVPEPRRDAGDPGRVPHAEARADGYRTRDDRADVVRALRAQDAEGESSIHGEELGRHSHRPGRPGHTINADGSISIDNLLKSTVAAARSS
jgi:phosphoribosylformylglycinamidine (FGAM) synthase PurS component